MGNKKAKANYRCTVLRLPDLVVCVRQMADYDVRDGPA